MKVVLNQGNCSEDNAVTQFDLNTTPSVLIIMSSLRQYVSLPRLVAAASIRTVV